MILLESFIASTLRNDTTLTAVIPATNIMIGQVDVPIETHKDLIRPQINIHLISEMVRTVPIEATECRYQIDIWSINNQLAASMLYERVKQLLNFQTATIVNVPNVPPPLNAITVNPLHIFWSVNQSASYVQESSSAQWNVTSDWMFWVKETVNPITSKYSNQTGGTTQA